MSQCLRCVMGAMVIGVAGMTATAQFVVHVSPQNLGTIKGVSNDGLVAGENTLGRLYRWRPGMVEISPVLNSGISVTHVTAHTSVALVQNASTGNASRIGLWPGGSVTALPAVPPSIAEAPFVANVELTAASADGTRLFGTYLNRDEMPPMLLKMSSPWTWTADEGYTELPTPPAPSHARHGTVRGASSNGNYVVGRSGINTAVGQPSLWSRSASGWSLTMLPFPTTPGPISQTQFDSMSSSAVGVSADGRVVVGSVTYESAPFQQSMMFVRWVDGVVSHTLMAPTSSALASSARVSDDGQLALLRLSASNDVIWQSDGSTIPILDYLTQMGAVFPDGASLSLVRMSADGRTFAGRIAAPSLDTFRQFVVTIPTPATLPLLALAGTLAARRRR